MPIGLSILIFPPDDPKEAVFPEHASLKHLRKPLREGILDRVWQGLAERDPFRHTRSSHRFFVCIPLNHPWKQNML